MTELYFLVKFSVKPYEGVSQQLEVMEKIDYKIKLMHYIVYCISALIISVYLVMISLLIFLIVKDKNLSDGSWASIDKLYNSYAWFKEMYSWTSTILLLLFAAALITVFLLLNRTLKDNMISEQMTRDKQIINRLFGIFVLAYLIGALYYFFFG